MTHCGQKERRALREDADSPAHSPLQTEELGGPQRVCSRPQGADGKPLHSPERSLALGLRPLACHYRSELSVTGCGCPAHGPYNHRGWTSWLAPQ